MGTKNNHKRKKKKHRKEKNKKKGGFKLKIAWKEMLMLIFIGTVSVIITNLYYLNNYIVYEITDETTKDVFGNVKTYSEEDADALKKMFEAYEKIKTDYVFGVTSEQLVDGALYGMTQATEDIHTTYVPPTKEEEMISERLSNEYYGIGVEVSIQNEEPTIMNIFKDSPAEEAGLKVNDKIVKAGKIEYKGQELSDFISNIKGEKGTFVNLGIKREDVELTIKVERREIKRETVSYEMKNKNTAYIDVDGFYDQTHLEFENALKEVEKNEIDTLIIDLRNNTGGYLVAAKEMASLFLDKTKVILQYETKEDVQKIYSEKDQVAKKDYKIKILINETTASSSEILTLALKENLDNVEIIGTESYGKGVVQQASKMKDGSELKITTAKWLSPKGNWLIEGEKGIQPDIKVENDKIYGLIGLTLQEKGELSLGDDEPMIEYIKDLMILEGYKMDLNTIFDESLEKAIKEIQKENKLKETGRIGEKEMKIINEKITKNNENMKDLQLEKAMK